MCFDAINDDNNKIRKQYRHFPSRNHRISLTKTRTFDDKHYKIRKYNFATHSFFIIIFIYLDICASLLLIEASVQQPPQTLGSIGRLFFSQIR